MLSTLFWIRKGFSDPIFVFYPLDLDPLADPHPLADTDPLAGPDRLLHPDPLENPNSLADPDPLMDPECHAVLTFIRWLESL